MFSLDHGQRMRPLLDDQLCSRPRQELPETYVLNGAVYAAKTHWLRQSRDFISNNTAAYVMPKARSLDVDYEFDLKVVDLMLKDGRMQA